MLQPALEGPRHRFQTARIVPVPIPMSGWSTRDKYVSAFSKAALKYCPYTDNWMWVDGRVTIRPGYSSYATGMTDPVRTLMEYSGTGGTKKIFAATYAAGSACKIWDASSAGAASSLVTGLVGADWQSTMFATTSGNYLMMANGADAFRAYDGTNFSTPSLTGVTAANIINVASHKGRLWLVEKSTLNAWYLPAFAISGTASKFNLGPFCPHGGYLMAIGSWSLDSGNGPDDLIVFVTSEGDVVVYQGLDPNSTSEWGLVGVYKIDKPIGRRCLTKFGADLVVFTESGPVRLSNILSGQNVDGRDLLADAIRDEFVAASTSYKPTFGWEISTYTKRGGWLWANIPQSATAEGNQNFAQYVFNPLMNAWFRLTGLNGYCFLQSADLMHFGGNGQTYIWDNDQIDDDGSAVTADIGFGWWNYGTGNLKDFTLMRPHFFTDGELTPVVEMKVEFDESAPTSQAEATEAPAGGTWDDDDWDDASWSGGLVPVREWLTASGSGTVAAPRIKVSTISAKVSLTQVDVAFVDGGIL